MIIHRAIAALAIMLSFSAGQPARAADVTIGATSLDVSPITVKSGASVVFKVTGKANQALSGYQLKWTLGQVGTNATLDMTDVVNLPASKATVYSHPYVIPAGTPPGPYTIAAEFDNGSIIYSRALATFLVTGTPAPPPPPPPPSGVEVPGPNAALYNAPWYQCKVDLHVDPVNGNDGGDGSKAAPWKTIRHADAGRVAGDCVHVAPGLDSEQIVTRSGGNAPTPTGYVVYRCDVMDACHIKSPGTGQVWLFQSPANFVVVDGFEVDGNSTAAAPDGVADVCIDSTWDTNRWYDAPNNDSVHHAWVMNSVIHHCNLAGIDFSNKEWIYVLHNRVYHNSWTSGYEGSGIGLVVFQCIEAGNPSCASHTATTDPGTYVPSGMDLTYAQPYHVLVEGNDVYDNSEAHSPIACGSHTDGNGIIMDTFEAEPDNKIMFPYPSAVRGNLSHGNGARGLHVFATSNVTVSGNTAYGNGLDNCVGAYGIGDLSQQGGANNVWVNNVSYSITAKPGGLNTSLVAGNGRGVVDANNTYSNNVLFGGVAPMIFDADIGYYKAANQRLLDPKFASAPANFALQSVSPAIGYALPGYGTSTDAGACDRALASCP